jgi:beta-glucosidase
MLMAPYSWEAYIPALVDLVKEGTVSQERIDDAVRRILTVKAKLGLFENCYADYSLADMIGSKEHREVARRAVRESLVLLKNDYDALNRLRKAEKILVAGYAAESIGMQCGGWTITWQGGANISQEGMTFLKAIKAVDGKKITYSDSGAGAKKCDAAVVVVGELPYAEGNGDDGSVNNPNPAGLRLDPEAYAMISAIKEENPDIPVVVVLYSGRPLVVNDELRMADAFIAAWLPGTEAEGITDVLFGDYGFTGKLSYPWPADAAQLETRFEVGYGLN